MNINAFLLQKRSDPIHAQHAVPNAQNEIVNDEQKSTNYYNKNDDVADITAANINISSLYNNTVLDATSFRFGSNNNSSSSNNNSKNTSSVNTINTGNTAMMTFNNFGFAGVESRATASTKIVTTPEQATSSLPSAAMFGFGNITSTIPATTHNAEILNLNQKVNTTVPSNVFGFGQSSDDTHDINANNSVIATNKVVKENCADEISEVDKNDAMHVMKNVADNNLKMSSLKTK